MTKTIATLDAPDSRNDRVFRQRFIKLWVKEERGRIRIVRAGEFLETKDLSREHRAV
jgi:hypothetical protein